MTSGVLLEALARFSVTGPEFGGFLANHGPMAVEALTLLHGEDAVPAWVDGYVDGLDEAPRPGRDVTDATWRDRLGRERLVGDWTSYFLRQVSEADWRTVLTTWWPRLLPGLAASATHGLIRTAHAVRSLASAGQTPDPLLTGELARGLGLWAARYHELPGPAGPGRRYDAVRALSALPRLPAEAPSRGPGVNGRLAALVELPELPGTLAGWRLPRPADDALTELISAAARVVAARPDAPIPLCHTVTAPAAIRLVLPHLDPAVQRASVRAAWVAVGAIVAAYASPRVDAEARALHPDDHAVAAMLERLAPAAVEHGDEHVIKLTEAALREHQISGNPTLLVAADRFRGRLG